MTTGKITTYPAIPVDAGQVQGWKDIPIKNNASDPLVPLGPLSQNNAVMTSSVYFGEHSNSPYAKPVHALAGSLLTLFARQSTARRLLAAERRLPANHHLLIFDAYRPYQVQKSLHDFFKQQLHAEYPDMDDAALELETQKYVSLPSIHATRPSPHNTGGVIDLAIVQLDASHEAEVLQIRSRLDDSTVDFPIRVSLEIRLSAIMQRHSKMLDFGTAFDHGSEKSALAYYESKIAAGEILTRADERACNNRRLLYKVMTEAGFQPYFAEWWHFNAPESQMGAATAGHASASLGPAKLDKNNIAHENMRLAIRREILKTDDANAHPDWTVEIMAPSKK